ncbi:MAG: C4-dicarboxylate TRAP transporter substrate-binding protein [Clostridiaceae bacterium]|nr:C4-dicarboxylate TRAP transporter substrate-binding protein [Clostridiaceae bacterium]
MRYKRILSMGLAAAMAAGMLTGCSSSAQENTGNAASGADDGAADQVVIQLGYENNPGEAIDLGCNEWARLVEEKSGGTMKIEVFPSSQLGAKVDLIDQMLAGAPVITLADGAFYADRGVPDFGILFGPYLFSDWEECWTLTESDLYADLCSDLEEQGLKILTSNWIYGDRHILSKKPIRSLADLKGMKIRVPSNDIQVEGMQVLGANPTPMALGDVYTALQQGTIDGFEQPITVIYAGKYYEAAKYLTLTEHVKNNTTWICGTDFFNSLTAEQQQILIECGEEAGIYNNEQYFQQEEEALNALKEAGVEVIEIDKDEFREAAQSFYQLDKFTSVWSDGLYDRVKEAMGA